MGGRKFAQYNTATPVAVVALLDKRPACFDADSWALYLLDVHRGTLNDPANRARLCRGEAPDYCSECTVGYANKMRAEGRCFPINSTVPEGVVQGLACRREGAARAAPEPSGSRPGLDVKGSPAGSSFNAPLRANAPSNFAPPLANRNWLAGLCVESEGTSCAV